MDYKRELRRYVLSSKNARKAISFNKENPNIYNSFVWFATEAKTAGMKKYSIESLFNRVRWHVVIEKRNRDFKLNNNYKAYFARKLMADFKQFEDFFDIRETKGDNER